MLIVNIYPNSPIPQSPIFHPVEQFSDLDVEKLELLIPWDLPVEEIVSDRHKIKLIKAINSILEASQSQSYQEELKIIDQALDLIGKVKVYSVEIDKTQAHLDTWEVKDYDRYFRVSHVKTKNSAIALIKSILITYKTFIQLIIENPNLDPNEIKIQRQSFINYAYLLARVFNISL